jgi:AbrB family looped-hinge helix DNA binding protein
MITESVTVSNRGYIILPAHIRKEMKIKPGTRILLSKEDNKVILQPVSSFTEKISGLTAGCFGKDKKAVDDYIVNERKNR